MILMEFYDYILFKGIINNTINVKNNTKFGANLSEMQNPVDFMADFNCGARTFKGMKENPQKLTQLSSRSHPRHLVGKRTAQKDTIIYITSDSQVNSNFPNRWSPASLTFKVFYSEECLLTKTTERQKYCVIICNMKQRQLIMVSVR